jgi:inner membrane protein COX18
MVTYMELSVGGIVWMPNLLVPDESLILPVSLGLINLAIVEVGGFL